MSRSPRPIVLLTMLALAPACGSSSPSGPAGGPVAGPADQHCTVGGMLTKTKVGMCRAPGQTDAGAQEETDGGDDGGAPAGELGKTLFNASGYDDECKYQVSFTSTPIRKDENVTFTLTLTGLDPAGPVEDADIDVEAFLGDTHVAPNTNPRTAATSPGVYTIGPIKFDRSGDWTIRFHFFETCADEPADTPHGHVAFHIDVP